MAALLGAQEVMCALAAALQTEQDLAFCCALVQALNLILLTAPEVLHPPSWQTHPCTVPDLEHASLWWLSWQPPSSWAAPVS